MELLYRAHAFKHCAVQIQDTHSGILYNSQQVRWTAACLHQMCAVGPAWFFVFFFFWVTGELSTLRQMMKVPNEPGLSLNNGLENVFRSDQSMASNPRKGQAKRPGAKTTSHDGKAGHVVTHVCHRVRQEERQV